MRKCTKSLISHCDMFAIESQIGELHEEIVYGAYNVILGYYTDVHIDHCVFSKQHV